MTVIDLGDRTEPTEPRRRRRRPPPSRSFLVPVALVVLLVLTGAAPPAPRLQAILPSSLSAQVFLTGGGQIVAVKPVTGVADGSQELLAYRQPERATGAPQQLTALWRTPVGSAQPMVVERVDDSALVFSLTGTDAGMQTMLLDSRTGQLRWRQNGVAVFVASHLILLQTYERQDLDRVAAVDVASGRELWSVSSKAFWPSYHQDPAEIDVVVVTTVDGDVEVLDARSGTRRGRLPADADDPGDQRYASVIGDLVVVRSPGAVAAYQLDGLARRWRTDVQSVERIYRCGALICAPSAGSGVHLLDPATGALRWTVSEGFDVLHAGDRRALVVDHRQRPPTVATIEAGTGRPPTADDSWDWDLVQGFGVASHPLGTRSIPDVGAVLARLDPADGQPRRIDLLPGAVGNCRHRDGLIVCRRRDGNFGLWQLRD
ncbi:PQQ-binding-like beta-propeller repeat protein [Micromonospora gifhornensis]|uniref:outer membrane protein assembly factor BamB family protein n=1 Tax=Micromonospora gifhornensis TaxID=84594 RepID=UPI003452DB0B